MSEFEHEAPLPDVDAIIEARAMGLPEPGQEPEPSPQGPLRDSETGRFVARQEVEEGDEGPEEQESLILGKFRSPDEVVSAYQNLEPELGRLRNEVGELRQREEQVRQYLAQRQALEHQRQQEAMMRGPDPATASRFDQILEDNPAQALDWALSTGNRALFDKGLDEWYEADPRRATEYHTARQMQGLAQAFEQRLNQNVAPLAAERERGEFLGSWEGLKSRLPDLDTMAPAMLEVAKAIPAIAESMRSLDRAERERSIEFAYHAARSATGQPREAPEAAAPPQQNGYVMAPSPSGGFASGGPGVDSIKQAILDYNSTILPIEDVIER